MHSYVLIFRLTTAAINIEGKLCDSIDQYFAQNPRQTMSTKYTDVDSPITKTNAPPTQKFWDCAIGTYIDDPCNWCSFRGGVKSDSSATMASRTLDHEDDDTEFLLGATRPSYEIHEESAFEYAFCFGGPPTACDDEPSFEEELDVEGIACQTPSNTPNAALSQSHDATKAVKDVHRRKKSCFGVDALSIVSEEPSTLTAIHNAEQGHQLTKELNKTFQLIGLDAHQDQILEESFETSNGCVENVEI